MMELALPMKVTRVSPIDAADPAANSQLPEISISLLRYPVIEELEDQEMLAALSLPVFVTVPPIDRLPFTVTLPDAVRLAMFALVALIERKAPLLIIIALQTPVVPEISG
jgi:hypothetical protein